MLRKFRRRRVTSSKQKKNIFAVKEKKASVDLKLRFLREIVHDDSILCIGSGFYIENGVKNIIFGKFQNHNLLELK